MVVFQRLLAVETKVLPKVIDELLGHLHLEDLPVLDRDLPSLDDLRIAHLEILPQSAGEGHGWPTCECGP
jgi:hypothetical protein